MKKTLVLLAVLVAIILALVGVPRLLSLRKSPDLFNGFDKAGVARIDLKKSGSQESLKKVNGKWFATQNGEYPADTAKVNAALDMAAKQKKNEPRSKNPAKFKELGLDTASALKVVLDGGRKFSFFVGNMAQGWTGNFLRFEGRNEAYVTEGNFEQCFSSSPNFFRDKKVLDVNKDKVSEFSAAFRGDSAKSMTEVAAKFDAASGKWRIEKPENAEGDAAKINEWLGKFGSLEADDWYEKDTAAATGFDDPVLRATFKHTDGLSTGILVGKEQNGKRYVQADNSPHKFLLAKYRIDGLMQKDWRELIALPPVQGDTSKVDMNSVTVPGSQGKK